MRKYMSLIMVLLLLIFASVSAFGAITNNGTILNLNIGSDSDIENNGIIGNLFLNGNSVRVKGTNPLNVSGNGVYTELGEVTSGTPINFQIKEQIKVGDEIVVKGINTSTDAVLVVTFGYGNSSEEREYSYNAGITLPEIADMIRDSFVAEPVLGYDFASFTDIGGTYVRITNSTGSTKSISFSYRNK